MEHQLLQLLEYRQVLGALTTSLDGLLVASVAVDTADAELIAASTAGYNGADYRVAASEHGSLHVARGRELRLIVLAEPGTPEPALRTLLLDHLAIIEDSMSV